MGIFKTLIPLGAMNTVREKNKVITRKQLYAINGLRGVASLCDVLFHMLQSHFHKTSILRFFHLGYLIVDFFSIITGFLLGYSYDDRKDTLTAAEFLKR